MAKTLILGPVLYPQNHFREFYLYLLDIVLSYHLIQLERKLTFLKPNFGSNFDPISPNLGPSMFFVGFTSNSSLTLFQAIILCNFQETNFRKW